MAEVGVSQTPSGGWSNCVDDYELGEVIGMPFFIISYSIVSYLYINTKHVVTYLIHGALFIIWRDVRRVVARVPSFLFVTKQMLIAHFQFGIEKYWLAFY